MNIAFKTIQKYFYKIRDWYDPMITAVSKPVQTDGENCFYPVYKFTVHYGDKSDAIVIDLDNPANWAGGTPESKIRNLYDYYVKKMQKQQRTRSR